MRIVRFIKPLVLTTNLFLIAASFYWLGCDTPRVATSVAQFKQRYAYTPEPAPGKINAIAIVKTTYGLSPNYEAMGWGKMGAPPEEIANFKRAWSDVVYADFANSDLFEKVLTGSDSADLLLDVRAEISSHPGFLRSDFNLDVEVTVRDPNGSEPLKLYKDSSSFQSGSIFAPEQSEAMRSILGRIKSSIFTDFRNFGEADASLESTNLESLLAVHDRSLANARQRNRNLIAAKDLTLASTLRTWKTAELQSLAVRVEQVILDLSHESELEEERGQHAVENGTGSADRHREIALVYKERINILKPILAAIQNEVGNRNK